MTITDEKLDQLQAICDAATPGHAMHLAAMPCDGFADQVAYFAECARFGSGKMHGVAVQVRSAIDINDEALFVAFTGNGPTSEANARFIAAAGVEMPQLIAEVRRLRGIEAERDEAFAEWKAIVAEADEARGDFNGLLEQFEATNADDFLASVLRRNGDATLEIAHLRESLAARDAAVSAAAAEVAALRGDRDIAVAAMEAMRADRDAARKLLLTRVDASRLDEAVAARVDAESTLEAVREELQRTRSSHRAQVEIAHESREEFIAARRTCDLALSEVTGLKADLDNERDSSTRAVQQAAHAWRWARKWVDIVVALRRRLSEQATTIRGYEQSGDPGCNVTQGLLRVEERSARIAWIDRAVVAHERDQLRAEVERLRPLGAKLGLWRDLRGTIEDGNSDDGGSEADDAEDEIANVEWEMIRAVDVLRGDVPPTKCPTCDGTLAPDGSCPTCEAAAGIARDGASGDFATSIASYYSDDVGGARTVCAPLDPETGAAILRHIRTEKAIEAEERKGTAGARLGEMVESIAEMRADAEARTSAYRKRCNCAILSDDRTCPIHGGG